MPSITNEEMHALLALRDAAREALRSARLIRATQGRSVVKTDIAMQKLREALTRADSVTFSNVRRKRT